MAKPTLAPPMPPQLSEEDLRIVPVVFREKFVGRLAQYMLPRALGLLKKRDFGRYIHLFQNHETFYPFMALDFSGLLTDKEYWPLLRDVWTGNEVVTPYKRDWLDFFTAPRRHRNLLMTHDELQVFDKLPDEITIFRGYQAGKARMGMSWSLSELTAIAFSSGLRFRGDAPPKLVRATCKKTSVLAYINERSEEEIVVWPRWVHGVKNVLITNEKKTQSRRHWAELHANSIRRLTAA